MGGVEIEISSNSAPTELKLELGLSLALVVHYCFARQPLERRPTGTPNARAKNKDVYSGR